MIFIDFESTSETFGSSDSVSGPSGFACFFVLTASFTLRLMWVGKIGIINKICVFMNWHSSIDRNEGDVEENIFFWRYLKIWCIFTIDYSFVKVSSEERPSNGCMHLKAKRISRSVPIIIHSLMLSVFILLKEIFCQLFFWGGMRVNILSKKSRIVSTLIY